MGMIEVDNLVKKYGDFTALRGVSLTIADGEFLCLLGPSGCGKTTLMRSIAGLVPIEGGRISVDGTLFSEPGYSLPSEKRRLGMVFQSYALWPHMTVHGNIAYTLKTNRWPKEKIGDRVAEVLDLVGLPGMEKRYAAHLSGGQMQRVALARSLAPEPSVLLFDEPLSNLDSKLREKMRFEIRRIQQRVGITAVYVTHDQAEAMVVADRIALMNQGELVQIGSARDLYERPNSPFAADFMGTTNFLVADVGQSSGGIADLRLPGGVTIRGQLLEQLHGEDRVTVAVRPEYVKLHGTPPTPQAGATVVEGTIEEIVYLGHLAEVYVRVGETRLRSQTIPDAIEEWEEGRQVWVLLEEQRVRAVEAAGAASSAGAAAAGEPSETPAMVTL